MKEKERALRAARSYAHNHALKPKVEERLARAQSQLESYLLRTGQTEVRLGPYQIALRDGQLWVDTAPPDGWRQTQMAWKDDGG